MNKEKLIIEVANEYERMRSEYDETTYRDLALEIPDFSQKILDDLSTQEIKQLLFNEDIKMLKTKNIKFLENEIKELKNL